MTIRPLPIRASISPTPKTKGSVRRKILAGSVAVGILIAAGAAVYYWHVPTGGTSAPQTVEQGVVIASRTVNGLEVKVLNAKGELHNDKNKVTLEFHDAQSGDLVDVGKVQFALSMNMPGMLMRSPANIAPTRLRVVIWQA